MGQKEKEKKKRVKTISSLALSHWQAILVLVVYIYSLCTVGQPIKLLCHIISALLRVMACDPSIDTVFVFVEYF